MSKSQATLREVGTTNRTRIADYERAITDRTRLLLRVHRSNFAITGFTEQPALTDLVELSRRRNIPLLEDLGSGALFDLRSIGIDEPGVLDSLRAGVDMITYSGDKLLGGPQAGLISGRADLVARMRSNSLFRALRVDKVIYAALEATLLAYVKHEGGSKPPRRSGTPVCAAGCPACGRSVPRRSAGMTFGLPPGAGRESSPQPSQFCRPCLHGGQGRRCSRRVGLLETGPSAAARPASASAHSTRSHTSRGLKLDCIAGSTKTKPPDREERQPRVHGGQLGDLDERHQHPDQHHLQHAPECA